MKTMAIVSAAALLMVGAACAGSGEATAEESAQHKAAQHTERDNTAVNARDRGGDTVTAQDQSENETDRTLTQKIRQAIVADDSLSTNAKNVKVITNNGVVTLRGPVASERERNTVAAKVNGVAGVKRIDNQLEIAAR